MANCTDECRPHAKTCTRMRRGFERGLCGVKFYHHSFCSYCHLTRTRVRTHTNMPKCVRGGAALRNKCWPWWSLKELLTLAKSP